MLFIISRDALNCSPNSEPMAPIYALKEKYPECPVLVLGDAFDMADVLAALNAGASGYLMCTLSFDALVKSLDLVMLGETVISSDFVRAVCNEVNITRESAAPTRLQSAEVNGPNSMTLHHVGRELSDREMAILSRLLWGESNKNIARCIGIAEATVKSHVKAILRKINVKNRTQAAMWAHTHLPQQCEVALEAPLNTYSGPNGRYGSAITRNGAG